MDGGGGLRSRAERCVFSLGGAWVGACLAARDGRALEGGALTALCLGLATWQLRLPRAWLAASRTCPDHGTVYVALCAIVMGSALCARPDDAYRLFLFWGAIGLACQFVAAAAVPRGRAAAVAALSAGSALLWRQRAGAELAAAGPAAAQMLAASATLEGLVWLWPRALAKSFTVGEAMLVLHALALLLADFGAFALSRLAGPPRHFAAQAERGPLVVALEGGLLGVLAVPLVMAPFFKVHAVLENETADVDPRNPSEELLARRRRDSQTITLIDWSSPTLTGRTTALFYVASLGWLCAGVAPAVSVLMGANPILWVRDYTFSDPAHAAALLYWVVVLAVGLPVIHAKAASSGWPLIITRKLYHLLALVMFGPAVVLVPSFLGLSCAIATALLLYIEYIRICRVPPFGAWLHFYLRSYTDSRDEGTTILTHIYLLVGCAAPLWIFSDPAGGSFAPLGGLVILGAGDAAGAIVGSTRGRIFWPGGRKTLEGTAAAAVSCLASFLLLRALMPTGGPLSRWKVVLPATLLTCLLEAFTKQIDNLTLPIFFSALLSLPVLP